MSRIFPHLALGSASLESCTDPTSCLFGNELQDFTFDPALLSLEWPGETQLPPLSDLGDLQNIETRNALEDFSAANPLNDYSPDSWPSVISSYADDAPMLGDQVC